jgi:type II secretory pathway component PulK
MNQKTLLKQSAYRWALNSSGGSILLITLWSLFLLAAFAVTLGYEVRQKATLSNRLDVRERLYLLAEGGILKGISKLTEENSREFLTLNYLNGISGQSTPDFFVSASDEEAKININKCGLEELSRLFQIVLGFEETKAQELAACIIDWRDPDEQLSLALDSAESPYYKNLAHPYGAKNADFEIFDELLLVKDVTPQIYQRIKPYITLYGSGKINVNTASIEVLAAIGFSKELADKIILFRSGKDTLEGTPDDSVFASVPDISVKLSQAYQLGEPELEQLKLISDMHLEVSSGHFLISSTAKLQNSKLANRISCVADNQGKILYWQESFL